MSQEAHETPLDQQAVPLISVVIAVHNGGSDIEACLTGVDAQDYPNLECILVDDASTDGMAALSVRSRDVRLLTLDRRSGPAAARNAGAELARGDILFFTDADVVLDAQALLIAARCLGRDERIAAVFGSYDAEPGDPAYLSQYRNLLHHWVHQHSAAEASTFWSGCGAVRRRVFQTLGGFDTGYPEPSIEDIELGARMRKAGHAIRLERSMYGKHLKSWRFWNMVRTDLARRAIPWMELILRQGEAPRDLNLDSGSRIATVAAALFLLAMAWLLSAGRSAATLPALALLLAAVIVAASPLPAAGARRDGIITVGALALLTACAYGAYLAPWGLLPLALLGLIALARWNLYAFLCHERNVAFALAALPMQVVHFIVCALAVPLGAVRYLYLRRLNARA